VIKNIWYFR